MRPDEEALRADLQLPSFRVGARRGRWALRGLCFPHVLFFIAAAPRRAGPTGFLLRSECQGYRAMAPTSQLWHGRNNAALASGLRPQTHNGAVMEVFKDWQHCLYHPIDRKARDHNGWDRTFPEKLWTPSKDITFLLETVYDLLHGSDYLGAALPVEALDLPSSFVDGTLARAS
jgi:hypothetical protein